MKNMDQPKLGKLIRVTTVPQSLQILLKGQLRFMNNYFQVIAISSPGLSLQKVGENEEVKVVSLKMTRVISPIKDLKALFQLILLFIKERPDIVHTHTPKAGILGMLAAYMTGVPHRLHTVAGLPLLETKENRRRLLDFVEKVTYACATRIYPNSFGLLDIILANKYTKKDKLKVIGNGSSNGIDTLEFDPGSVSVETCQNLREGLGIERNDFIFLFVGRVVSHKGINELVQAFIYVNRNYPESHLIIVGAGESCLDPLDPEINKLMLEHRHIHALGYQSKVVNYFALADVLVFPSYREGFPNVVMQAASMQLNCIVSNVNGCNEIIKDGENGWVVPPKNVDKLRERMEWCIDHKDQSRQMGLKGRNFMQTYFERRFVWNEILSEYRSVLSYR